VPVASHQASSPKSSRKSVLVGQVSSHYKEVTSPRNSDTSLITVMVVVVVVVIVVVVVVLHRSTTYVDAVYCYRPNSVSVGRSVTLEPCENG